MTDRTESCVKIVRNWEEFEQELTELRTEACKAAHSRGGHVSRLWFRGQRRCDWELTTTLERESDRRFSLAEYYKVIHNVRPQIRCYTGKPWDDIPSPDDYEVQIRKNGVSHADFPALEYLSYLRHHRFPSPLLDWTESPYIAAFFALADARKRDVACADSPSVPHASIYVYREYGGRGKAGIREEPHIWGLWESEGVHPRSAQQQSRYTVCVMRDRDDCNKWYYASHETVFSRGCASQDRVWKLNIPVSERVAWLRRLDEMDINKDKLFGSEDSLIETLALPALVLRSE